MKAIAKVLIGLHEYCEVPKFRSSLIWVCTVCPDLSVRKLRVITVSSLLNLYFSCLCTFVKALTRFLHGEAQIIQTLDVLIFSMCMLQCVVYKEI